MTTEDTTPPGHQRGVQYYATGEDARVFTVCRECSNQNIAIRFLHAHDPSHAPNAGTRTTRRPTSHSSGATPSRPSPSCSRSTSSTTTSSTTIPTGDRTGRTSPTTGDRAGSPPRTTCSVVSAPPSVFGASSSVLRAAAPFHFPSLALFRIEQDGSRRRPAPRTRRTGTSRRCCGGPPLGPAAPTPPAATPTSRFADTPVRVSSVRWGRAQQNLPK